MDRSSSAGAQLQPAAPSPAANAGSIVLRVAWLAILLGLIMQVLLIASAAAFGKVGSSGRILTNTLQTISWSTFVCVGIAIGAVVSKLQVGATALAGLISAPIAFNIARVVQRGVAAALQLPVAKGGPSPLVLGGIKALEYGVLGAVISLLASRKKGGYAYAVAGFAVGVVFGGAIVVYTYSQTHGTLADLLPRAVNEILFPLGCSLVLFASEAAGKHLKTARH
jgi:hypothetical protein